MQADALLIDRCNALLPGGYAAYFPQTALPRRGVTVNTLRATPQQFAAKAPFAVQQSPFCAAGFILPQAETGLGRHPYHHAGVYYAQEPSASAAAPLLGVQPGERVLDLCAAPGGKTAQLAAALGGTGVLYANEFVAKRAAVLLSNVERMGAPNVVVLNETAEHLGQAFCGFFDRILVDAPCSGEGMFDKEPAALAQHSEQLIEQCAALQRQLLAAIAPALRPGGTLLYSTCTFAPQEDEGTVGAFLRTHPDFALEDLSGAGFGCAGHESCCTEGPVEVQKLRRIYPVHGGAGHFMARFRKAGQAAGVQPAAQPAKKTVPAPAQSFLTQQFGPLAQCAFALEQGRIVLLPDGAFLPRQLHILRAGVLAGEVVASGRGEARFEPHHHLYMAFGPKAAKTVRLPAGDERAEAWLRGEEIAAETLDGYAAVLYDGYPLGFGKASGGRVKNHYPKGLRNLK